MIEMLVVLGIIAILAAITFGLMSGTTERGRLSRAQTELRVISQALEQYRGQYGDYPWVGVGAAGDNERILFNALGGVIGPRGDEITDDQGNPSLGRVFVEYSRLNVEFDEEQPNRLPDRNEPQVLDNRFIDPWGNAYRYFYKNASDPDNWNRSGFILYSRGPSGADDPPGRDGIVPDSANNADNLHHDQ